MKKGAFVSYDVDLSDGLIILGVLCLAGAVWLALGWVGMLAFLGAIMLLVGLAMARNDRSKANKTKG